MYTLGDRGDGSYIIYNKELESVFKAGGAGEYIGSIKKRSQEDEKFVASAWNFDSSLPNNGGVEVKEEARARIYEGTIEAAFFKLKLVLTEYGFDGIMDLELPSGPD